VPRVDLLVLIARVLLRNFHRNVGKHPHTKKTPRLSRAGSISLTNPAKYRAGHAKLTHSPRFQAGTALANQIATRRGSQVTSRLGTLMKPGLVTLLSLLSVSLPACQTQTTPTSGPFTGSWANEDPDTRGITRVQFRTEGALLYVHMWGRCHLSDCDWGEATTLQPTRATTSPH
jgi:hypothetical protein